MPAVERMSRADLRVIRECLHAAVHGPFFDDEEFRTLIGFERCEIAGFLATWPRTGNAREQETAVNNVLSNLLGYPHNRWNVWDRYSPATAEEIAEVPARWRGDEKFDPSSRGFFDRLR